MISYSATLGYSTLLDRLSDEAVRDLDALMRSQEGEPLEVQREALMDLLPELGQQYADASSLVSAEFFTELQAMNEIRRPIAAETLPAVERGRWHTLAGWGSSGSVFEQGGAALMFSLLSGGLTEILTTVSADTIIGNAEIQGGMYYQRVPRSGCCSWCGMLASRHAAYTSKEAAETVVGRGVPVGEGRGRGSKGRGGGIKPRGSRRAGEAFHDHCRCRAVAVTENNSVQLNSEAERYYDAYRDAAEKAKGKLERNVTTWMAPDGTRYNEYDWVDSEGNSFKGDNELTKRIVAEMRTSLGVK